MSHYSPWPSPSCLPLRADLGAGDDMTCEREREDHPDCGGPERRMGEQLRLVQHRVPIPHHEGLWKPGETMRECVARELEGDGVAVPALVAVGRTAERDVPSPAVIGRWHRSISRWSGIIKK